MVSPIQSSPVLGVRNSTVFLFLVMENRIVNDWLIKGRMPEIWTKRGLGSPIRGMSY